MAKKIKIFVCLHDMFYVPDHALLEPIQVGTAIADKRMEGILHDNTGENISEKNRMYCELTAQYWAWKNRPELDYYGFFHYRRYLSFNPVQLEHWENITYFDYCDENAVERLMLNEENMRNLIENYDVIYPQENPVGGDTVYEHWCRHLVKKDMDILVQVIMEKYPDFYELTGEILNSKKAVHCNMFIMKREIFYKYNEWLFDILGECEKRIDFSGYSTEKYRTIGHMGERLCAIYSRYLERQGYKICYVQRAQFRNNEVSKEIKIKDAPDLVPLVLSCNNRYAKYASVLIESIVRNASSKYKYRIYILHTDITEENMKILEDQLKSSGNFGIDFIHVKRRMAGYQGLFVDRHLSIETYYRFLILEIFPNLSKILYLDCDTVVNEDISTLFFTDLENYSLGAVRDVDIISLYARENTADPEVRNHIDNKLKLKNHTDYFQAGVLLFNLKKIREKHSCEEMFQTALQEQWKFQDQDVLNSLFKNDVYFLPFKWNVLYECFNRAERVERFTSGSMNLEYKRAKMAPAIVHYAGTPKPWDEIGADLGNYFWKYAETSPFYESILHEMNIKMFKRMKEDKENVQSDEAEEFKYQFNATRNTVADLQMQVKDIAAQRDELQWRLDETRKSLSYKIALALTYIPRKLGRNNREK